MFNKLFLCVLVTVVMFYSCSDEIKNSSLTAQQEELLGYLPAETEFVMYMNLSELRKTEFWKDYFRPSISGDTSNNWLNDFELKTGSGIDGGIAEIFNATTWEGKDLFGVRFDRNLEKVKAYFNDRDKFSFDTASGRKMYSLNDGSPALFYFAKDDLLLIMKDKLHAAEIASGSYKKFDNKNPVYSIIRKIRYKNHYWLATNKGDFAAGLLSLIAGKKELPIKNIISSIKEISLSAHFTEGVDIASVWGCTDAKNAYLLSSGVRSALAMDLLAGKDYALNQLLKKLEIEREQKDVFFEININKDELAGLQKLAGKKKLSQKL